MPPKFLEKLPSPSNWSAKDALHWANELRVSCDALGIALKEAGIIDEATSMQIRRLRVLREVKIDPELPQDLSTTQRERKTRLLELGLSDYYVNLCFEAFFLGAISVGRLAEALLCSQGELAEFAILYGKTLHGN